MYWQRAIYLLPRFLMACAWGREERWHGGGWEGGGGGEGRSSTEGPAAPPAEHQLTRSCNLWGGWSGRHDGGKELLFLEVGEVSSFMFFFFFYSSSRAVSADCLALFQRHQSNWVSLQRGADTTGCKLNINPFKFKGGRRGLSRDLCWFRWIWCWFLACFNHM